MAVTTVSERFGRQYTNEITGQKSAVKVFKVFADSDYTILKELLEDAITAGLPDVGDPYTADSGDTNLIVFSHEVLEIEHELRYYNIQVNYEIRQFNYATPTDRIWKIQFSSLLEEYVPEQTLFNTGTVLPSNNVQAIDINKPVMNTAGDLFDPTVTDYHSLLRITLSKNVSDISDIGTIANIGGLMDFNNCVNDDQLTIAGISGDYFTFWMESINAENVIEQGTEYYRVTFNIVYNPRWHIKRVQNAGWRNAGGKKILGANGGTLSNPSPLDINGNALNPKWTPAQKLANTIYLGFGVKPLATFADLDLPTDFDFTD